MRQFGNRGRQLSVGEHLEIRHRVASGETFESAANAVGCSTKSVPRLIKRMGGLRPGRERALLCGFRSPSVRRFHEVSRGENHCEGLQLV